MHIMSSGVLPDGYKSYVQKPAETRAFLYKKIVESIYQDTY